MTFFQYISLWWTRFTPLEKRLLAEVRNVMPEAARPLFDAQVSAMTKSQRILQWNEIDYYPIRGGKIRWADVPTFPCTDEMELAEVRFKAAGKRYKATLFSIQGHIFNFHIQPGARPIAFTPWENTPTARLLDDPMRLPTGRKKPATLLPSWLDFLKRHGNGQLGDWHLYDAESAFAVSIEEGEFLVLAEREGDEFVLQRFEPPSAKLFFLESHDGTPEPLSRDLDSVFSQ